MSSEDHSIVKTPFLDKTPETVEEQPTATSGENTDLRPASNMSSSSGAEESFSVYVENSWTNVAKWTSSIAQTTTNPVELSLGHTTVAFSEPQIHAVLKCISDEAVRTSLHSMRALVLQAVYGGKGQPPARFRKALIGGESPFKAKPATSEIENDSEGYTTDGYTSGALASDEEIGIAGFGSGAQSGPAKSTQELRADPWKESLFPAVVTTLSLALATARVITSHYLPFKLKLLHRALCQVPHAKSVDWWADRGK